MKTATQKLEELTKTARRAFYNAKNVDKFMTSSRYDNWCAKYEALKPQAEVEAVREWAPNLGEAIA